MKKYLFIFLLQILLNSAFLMFGCNSDNERTKSNKDSVSSKIKDSSADDGFKDLDKKMDEISKKDSEKKHK
jgi:hypothetical protein